MRPHAWLGCARTWSAGFSFSSAFPRCFPGQMVSLDHHLIRGVDTPEELFTLIDYNDGSWTALTAVKPNPCALPMASSNWQLPWRLCPNTKS